MSADNTSWNLESFVDALVIELDKTRETLALKSINKSVSYTVKDMSMDLQIFPKYNGDQVTFLTAQPGETGASKVTLQLASVTDQQVRNTTKRISEKDDVKIDKLDIDEDTKKTLRKIGVTSANDLEEIKKKNVDIETQAPGKVDYGKLANLIQKAKRNNNPPKINKVSVNKSNDAQTIIIDGKNLSTDAAFTPVIVVNDRLVSIEKFNDKQLKIHVPNYMLSKGKNDMILTLDPYSICRLKITSA
jgi:hypothetical protein